MAGGIGSDPHPSCKHWKHGAVQAGAGNFRTRDYPRAFAPYARPSETFHCQPPSFNSVLHHPRNAAKRRGPRIIRTSNISSSMEARPTAPSTSCWEFHPWCAGFRRRTRGHWHAMDKGIRMATGEAFAILNSDDYYRPGILQSVGEGFARNPTWDGLFGDIVYVDEHGDEIFRREEACWDPQIILFGFGLAHHQALFLRKATYERLGSYRYREFKNTCDIEYLYRLVRAQAKIGHIPVLLVNFRFHPLGPVCGSTCHRQYGPRVRAHAARNTAVPGGWRGRVLMTYGRIKRQVEKLLFRGKCDLIPGKLLLPAGTAGLRLSFRPISASTKLWASYAPMVEITRVLAWKASPRYCGQGGKSPPRRCRHVQAAIRCRRALRIRLQCGAVCGQRQAPSWTKHPITARLSFCATKRPADSSVM